MKQCLWIILSAVSMCYYFVKIPIVIPTKQLPYWYRGTLSKILWLSPSEVHLGRFRNVYHVSKYCGIISRPFRTALFPILRVEGNVNSRLGKPRKCNKISTRRAGGFYVSAGSRGTLSTYEMWWAKISICTGKKKSNITFGGDNYMKFLKSNLKRTPEAVV